MLRKIVPIGWLAAFLLMLPSAGFCQEFKIGVMITRGAAEIFNEWKSTAEYLTANTGKNFTLVPMDFRQLAEATKDKKIDFVFTNSAQYAEFNKQYGVQVIATQIAKFKEHALDSYGAVIIVKNDNPISTLADFKGKTFGCNSRLGFGSWLVSHKLFLENGIDPNANFFKEMKELKTHDNVVYAVVNGAIDGGAVRSTIVEKMVQDGKIKETDFKVVHQIKDGYPVLHSTPVYPENPLAALPHVPNDLRQAVGKAMVALKSTDKAVIDAKIVGWKEPLDYTPVVELLMAIKYGAFGKDVQAKAPAPQEQVEKAAEASVSVPAATAPQAKPGKGRTSNL